MERDHHTEEAQERAVLYALGMLSDDEARAFEAHVLTGCVTCAGELRAMRHTADALGHAAAPVSPAASLWARVLGRVAAEPVASATIDKDGIRIVHPARLPWQPGRSPGIEIKTLFVDAQTGARSHLVRMPAGTTLAAHRHTGVEESYVIEGDLLVDGLPMAAGDYCRAEPGSLHRAITTERGCLFVAIIACPNEAL